MVLLTSENFIKSNSSISDNINTKFIQPAIRESQTVELQQVLGTELLDKLCELVGNGTISEISNIKYKELVDKCQYFLLYSTLAKICVLANIKTDNLGTYRSNDENAYSFELKDVWSVQDYYTHKSDYYKKELQLFLMSRHNDYPELSRNSCYDIHSNLYSAASGNMWLGGKRGKGRRRYPFPSMGYDNYYND